MTASKKQHHDFLEKVYQSQDVLYRICSVYTRNKEDWDDLWQEILLQLWRSFPSFKEKSSFSTWMYRVALNTALMHRRKKKRGLFSMALETESFATRENFPLHNDEEVQLLYESIQELPHIDRAIILLKLEQKSYQEIAEITGFSGSNVSVRIMRIKEKLRQLLFQKGVKGD
jgi:RNA polymerase sigma-70 factor (ECF subfamily)